MILPGTGTGAECVAMPGAWRKRVAGCAAAVARSNVVEGACHKHVASPRCPSTATRSPSPQAGRIL
jgi:hypothetical protein